ncbi:hypothetical protein BCON_0004g00710 [Botryotinia convoluta]|uniref:FAD/NAD(P)-binding domain-containing protein n=1 Tax=Botryotinia convoluta TaxID=54673 RepID=A0A4Z1IWG7_9HELO|nr:hypothetical protein BCON_0004g00710 [Botryotinia convoluta]
MSQPPPIDVLIIGGCPAGLTAASTLARRLHTAIVFDSGDYRNLEASYMHMVLTWDHKSPKQFRTSARRAIENNYNTIRFEDVELKTVKQTETGFEVADGNGKTWVGKKLILATGSANDFPDIPGYKECWGTGIFHCLFCHGYEERNSPSAGVLALQSQAYYQMAIHMAKTASYLSQKVTIYTNGVETLGEEISTALKTSFKASHRFAVDNRKISNLVKGDQGAEVILKFEDGSAKTESFITHNPNTHTKGPFAEQLGLKLTQTGDIDASTPFFTTSVRGVFAVGGSITPYKVVSGALSSGCNAAVAAAAQLRAEDLEHQPFF